MSDEDRTEAARRRAEKLLETTAFVRARLADAFSLAAAPRIEVGAREASGATSSGSLTVARLFARGDDALGVARVEILERARPASLESALRLLIDVLETTRVCVGTLRGALSPDSKADAARAAFLSRVDAQLVDLVSYTEELSSRTRLFVGQERFRRASQVVSPGRLFEIVRRALSADRSLDELIAAGADAEDEEPVIRDLLVAFQERLARDLANAPSSTERRALVSPGQGGFVLKLSYPDVVDVGEIVTITCRVRNDLPRAIRLAALDLDENLASVLEVKSVAPEPLGRESGEGVVTLAFDVEILPLETLDIVVRACAKEPRALSAEVSAWTESAEVAVGVVTLDVVLAH